jgi:hypothetical protein
MTDKTLQEKMKDHIEYIAYEVGNKIYKAKTSGALSGDENEHALIRACTKIVLDDLVLTKEATEIFKNLKHFV